MKKLFPLVGLIIMMVGHVSAQGLSKNEKNRLKNELKSYMKNLEGYKAKMEDVQMTLDSNEAEIKRLKDELAYTEMNQTEMTNKVNAYEREIQKLQTQNETLKNWNDSTYEATNPTPGIITPENANKGTVYKVQIGLYKNFNINKYFETPRYIGYETVDGMNRYVISYFDTEKVAMDFLGDIRKLGIKDAFVAKYVNGKRVYEWDKSTYKTPDDLKNTLQENAP